MDMYDDFLGESSITRDALWVALIYRTWISMSGINGYNFFEK